MHKQKGFTLIEVVGVMAVIAIIAAAAVPRIFGAIEDAKVSSLISQAKAIGISVVQFQKDTGKWPRHTPTSTDENVHQLMVNKGSGGQPIEGWDGPYLEQKLTNTFSPGGYQDVVITNSTAYACDLDGNGAQDGNFIIYRVDGITDAVAKKVSSIMDKDSNVETGDGSWKKAGRVKRYNGDHTSILLICLGRV